MDTFFGSLRHVFDMANKTHIIWCCVILLLMVMLAILHHFWKGDAKKLKIWRILCLLPLAAAVLHFLIYAFSIPDLAGLFFIMYAIPLLALLPIPFAKRRIGYRVTASITGVLSALLGFYFCATSPHLYNYTHLSYTDSFHALVQQMDKTYVLKEWKDVDFDALEDAYMPLVEAAETAQDPGQFYDAVNRFCMELHDGHIWVQPTFDTATDPLPTEPHDYGLAMVQLDDGSVIAVCTSEAVQQQGILDGDRITHWNGKPIAQAIAEDVEDQGFPVKANADRLAALQLSSIGGETVDVTVQHADGSEVTVTLSALDEPSATLNAQTTFSRLPAEDPYSVVWESNFSTKMLDDKCGYLVLNAEITDSDLQDTIGYLMGDHGWAREMFREKLRALKDEGMEYLVVDLRNNFGGFDEIGCALVSLLTEEDWYGQGLGIRRNGTYLCVSDHGIKGDGEFADLQVVALTNYNCASAGDGTALYLSKLPNVTLAGITDPNGCNQETGGTCLLSDGLVTVAYPVGLILNEEGVPNVDTASDRISRNPVEVRIPFDFEAASQIFFAGEDYELAWAMAYLEEHAE